MIDSVSHNEEKFDTNSAHATSHISVDWPNSHYIQKEVIRAIEAVSRSHSVFGKRFKNT